MCKFFLYILAKGAPIMLKENKSLITKAVLFLAILIVGGYFLFTSRDREYTPSPSPTPEAVPTPEPDPHVRRPITSARDVVICRCPNHDANVRQLTAPRPSHHSVVPTEIIRTNSVTTLL